MHLSQEVVAQRRAFGGKAIDGPVAFGDLDLVVAREPLEDPCAPSLLRHVQLAAGDDVIGGLVDDAEHALHRPVFPTDGRVGDVEEHVFQVAGTLDLERPVAGRIGFTRSPHAVEQRFQVIPQLAPVLVSRPPESSGVLVADGGRISVVIEGAVVIAPEQDDLDIGRQDDVHHSAKGPRPVRRIAEAEFAPVAFAHQPAKIAAADRPPPAR
jgi:hypothetical protein